MAFTNSPMVVHTNLSPNHSGKRTHAIDRISPNCVVGQCTAESLGALFATPDRQASSNYGIDRDGRVGMYVEEQNRSWCTSSKANDQRAITIECASDTTDPYVMKDVVYERLIELCADICKRNGKRKLLWLKDKDKTLAYEPTADEMVITVHRWFANKSCPGDWLFERLGDLADKVTAALSEGIVENPKEEPPVVDAEQTIWDFLFGKLGNAYGTAGLMGNIFAESGLKPTNMQNAYESKLGYNDAEYTAAVDEGTYGNFVRDSVGYGLAQWTYWSRKQALLEFAWAEDKSVGDLSLQLDFIWKELTESYGKLTALLKSATSVEEASTAVLTQYERPADMGETVRARRAGYGETFYKKFASIPVHPEKLTEGVYRVRKTWADSKSQLGAYKLLTNAKKKADKNPGYFVFDNDGVAFYPEEPVQVKEPFTIYTVVKGDTLWEIAVRYLGKGIRYKDIKDLNGLTSDTIHIGQKLKIPI